MTVAPSPSPPVSEEVESSTDTEQDLRFKDAVEEYVKTTWSTWTLGEKMGQCLVANAGLLTTETKEAIIKHGVEEAFDELSGVHLQSLASVWNTCEVEASTSDAPTSSAGSVATLDFESTIGVLLVVTHFQD